MKYFKSQSENLFRDEVAGNSLFAALGLVIRIDSKVLMGSKALRNRFPSGFVTSWGALLLFVLLAGGSGSKCLAAGTGAGAEQSVSTAEGPKPGAPSNPKDENPADLSSVEQSNIYKRANENLETQIVYIKQGLDQAKEEVNRLKKASENGGDPNPPIDWTNKEPGTIKKITAGFCTNVTQDTALDCLNQYRAVQLRQLQGMKHDLLGNQNMIGQLSQDQRVAQGAAVARDQMVPRYGANVKRRVLPKIPSFIDLSQNFKESGSENELQRKKEIDAFVRKVMSPPDPNEYLKTQDVAVNPDKKDGIKYSMYVLDAQGKPELDKKAYDQAVAAYNRIQALMNSSAKGKKGAAVQRELAADLGKRLMDMHPADPSKTDLAHAVGSNEAVTPQACANLDVGPRKNYCIARAIVVEYFNNEAPEQATKKPAASSGDPSALLINNTAQGSASASNADAHFNEGYMIKGDQGRAPASSGSTAVQAPGSTSSDESSTDALYMDQSYIDGVINDQLGE